MQNIRKHPAVVLFTSGKSELLLTVTVWSRVFHVKKFPAFMETEVITVFNLTSNRYNYHHPAFSSVAGPMEHLFAT